MKKEIFKKELKRSLDLINPVKIFKSLNIFGKIVFCLFSPLIAYLLFCVFFISIIIPVMQFLFTKEDFKEDKK
jgi:hypothetical protein